MSRLVAAPARVRLAEIVDVGSFRETEGSLGCDDPLEFDDGSSYRRHLAEARARTGSTEAVVTGLGRIAGRECVLTVFDFSFLGGSMGVAVGEKVARAMELSLARHVPFITIVATGGARMQEGMLSLVQMAKTVAVAARLHHAGVPTIAILADPTTGGVYASFATRCDIVLAEPEARIGFAGARVIEQVTGSPPPPGANTAEFLLERGQVDAIVPRAQLRGVLAELLGLLHDAFEIRRHGRLRPYRPPVTAPADPWQAVQQARRPDRPTSLDYIRRLMPSVMELRGDRLRGDDPALVAGIARLDGVTVAVLAQERGHGEPERRGGRVRPEGLRKATRVMDLAARWRLPVIAFVDTPGAELSYEAESGNLAGAIGACLERMLTLPVPVVSVIVGEGGSGAALALAVGDRILMQQNAIYSVIAPEGAAAILYGDAARARDVARSLRLTAYDCLRLGVVDRIVPEPEGGAHAQPDHAALLLRDDLLDALAELRGRSAPRLLARRHARFRRVGSASLRNSVDRARRATPGFPPGRALGPLRRAASGAGHLARELRQLRRAVPVVARVRRDGRP